MLSHFGSIASYINLHIIYTSEFSVCVCACIWRTESLTKFSRSFFCSFSYTHIQNYSEKRLWHTFFCFRNKNSTQKTTTATRIHVLWNEMVLLVVCICDVVSGRFWLMVQKKEIWYFFFTFWFPSLWTIWILRDVTRFFCLFVCLNQMIIVCLIGIFYFSKFKFFPICSLSRLTSHTHTHLIRLTIFNGIVVNGCILVNPINHSSNQQESLMKEKTEWQAHSFMLFSKNNNSYTNKCEF